MNALQWWSDTDRENSKYENRNLSQCHFATNSKQTDLGPIPDLRFDRLATNRLSYGTACFVMETLG
jgi:hypothetical protein